MLRCRRSWTAGHKLRAIIGKIFTLPEASRCFPNVDTTSTFHIVHFEVRTLTFRCQIDSRGRLRATCIAIYTSRQTMSQTMSQTFQKNLMNKYAANLMLFSKLGQFCQDTCQGNNLTSSIVDSWRICSNNLGAKRETLERTGYNFLKLLKLLTSSVFWQCWVAAARYTVSPVQPNVWATVVPVTLAHKEQSWRNHRFLLWSLASNDACCKAIKIHTYLIGGLGRTGEVEKTPWEHTSPELIA